MVHAPDDNSQHKVENLNASEQIDIERITYMEKLEKVNYNKEFKHNLQELMNMGFMDFKKNLILLSKEQNDL